jgi:DNA-binding PadR family transcriptional regulator
MFDHKEGFMGPRHRYDEGDWPEHFEGVRRAAAIRGAWAGGPFGPGPGPGPGFGAPFGGGRGRKRRGDVRVALLLLLAEEPRNGYQLMQTIEDRSGGRWRPSPGSVYPALAQLEDEGLIRAAERDGAKLFEITDAGREHVGERGDDAPPWAGDEDPATITDLKAQIKQLHIAAVQVVHAGDEEQVAQAARTLAEARRALYRILAEDRDA